MKNIELLFETYLLNKTDDNLYSLINALQPILGSYIRRIYGIKKDYEDVFSEGNIMLLENIKKYTTSQIKIPFTPYIISCIRFFALDLWKQKKINTVDESFLESIEDSNDSPDIILEKKDWQLTIFNALNKLSSKERDVLVYHYLLNKPLKVLSNNWNIPYSTLLKQNKRALKKMRKLLKGEIKNG